MLKLRTTAKFIKDLKRIRKRNLDVSLLDDVIKILQERKALPPRYRDHALTGNFVGLRECHILPDWLFIYGINDQELTLTAMRTGTHSDLL